MFADQCMELKHLDYKTKYKQKIQKQSYFSFSLINNILFVVFAPLPKYKLIIDRRWALRYEDILLKPKSHFLKAKCNSIKPCIALSRR